MPSASNELTFKASSAASKRKSTLPEKSCNTKGPSLGCRNKEGKTDSVFLSTTAFAETHLSMSKPHA